MSLLADIYVRQGLSGEAAYRGRLECVEGVPVLCLAGEPGRVATLEDHAGDPQSDSECVVCFVCVCVCVCVCV